MCELFALTSTHPVSISFSLERFAQRGGVTGPHRDGWGIGFYQGRDVQLEREAGPASESPSLEFLREHHFQTDLVMSHIRMATFGEVALHNTQPFARELGGRMHLFAHNGDTPGVRDEADLRPRRYRPIGNTDSEYAFCGFLEWLAPLWDGSSPPSLESRLDRVIGFARVLRPLGPANFLYSDSELLFIHGHRRTQLDGEIRPPGIHLLQRRCGVGTEIDGLSLAPTGEIQEVLLAASVPLTDEAWMPLAEGELAVARAGRLVKRVIPEAP